MSDKKEFHVDRWPPGIASETVYEVACDDEGREGGSWLRVYIGVDGDAYASVQSWEHIQSDPNSSPDPFPSIRVRTFAGGGRNIRTRQALLNLAEAIMLDKESPL